MPSKNPTDQLLSWYQKNFRPLPWRETRDPYAIWISEIMLQQTTVKAVLPFYERFMTSFPNVQALARAPLSLVYEHWSGLGYYSRARNLHKSSIEFAKTGMPTTYQELIQYPGFGPYTARAVASFAFQQDVGVLDGNVIRFLSRFHNISLEWWKPRGREILQTKADAWVKGRSSDLVNQALIEIGATICLPQNPKCLLCPLMKSCAGRTAANTLPLKKQKRESEIWIWRIQVQEKNKKFALTNTHGLPFLKNHWAWPGTAIRVKTKPKEFDFKHCVTHHSIYVQIETNKRPKGRDFKWLTKENVKKEAPTSLVNKAFSYLR
jgi:A/G-specific adenine glycosylase